MKVARKITLALFLATVLALALLGFVGARREIALYEASMADDASLIGRTMRPAFLEVWGVEGEARALDLLETADDALVRARLRYVVVGGGDPLRAPRAPLAALGPVHQSQVAIWTDHETADGGMLVAYVPLSAPAPPGSALEITEPLAVEKALLRGRIQEHLIALGTFAVFATLIASFVGVSFVGRPIDKLVVQARRVGQGDLSSRLALPQKDEIGELAREMNAMCDQLEKAQARIKEEAEARLRTLEQLRHADRLMTVGKLASGIAHELGTPLNVVSGRAKLIAAGKVHGAQVGESASIIAQQAERMTRIIRQLLDFARRRGVNRSTVDLEQIVRHASTILEVLATKHSVAIAISARSPLPSVELDPVPIEQVITNIVINGIQSMPEGGKLELELSAGDFLPPPEHGGARGAYVRLDVTDHGTGIAKDDLPRIFEPFFTTKDVGEGTGLGLSVAYGIVRDHGGWIAVASEPGQGATFSVYLPEHAPSA
ncbi:MAG: histidine kinase [Myxococcaceae bacterium]|nr:histidine kinase [Myxococcaceae bacterium]